MSYSIWLCSKRNIFFSTSQIFHFWNKVCEKKGKMFFMSHYILPSLIQRVEARSPPNIKPKPPSPQSSILLLEPPGPQLFGTPKETNHSHDLLKVVITGLMHNSIFGWMAPHIVLTLPVKWMYKHQWHITVCPLVLSEHFILDCSLQGKQFSGIRSGEQAGKLTGPLGSFQLPGYFWSRTRQALPELCAWHLPWWCHIIILFPNVWPPKYWKNGS